MLEWFSVQLLVNSEIFKLSLNLSPMHLRAKSDCYELKGDLSHVILKEIFHDSLKNFEIYKDFESQVGFEPTTLRDLVGCSNHLSYWRLYGEQGPICGSRLEPHHVATQPSNDWHTRSEELTNSIALSP